MAHFIVTDPETHLPQIIPVVEVKAYPVDLDGDHWEVANFMVDGDGAVDWLLYKGSSDQCRIFVLQVIELLRQGVTVIEPEQINPDLEIL